jgi:hypothetical protein
MWVELKPKYGNLPCGCQYILSSIATESTTVILCTSHGMQNTLLTCDFILFAILDNIVDEISVLNNMFFTQHCS